MRCDCYAAVNKLFFKGYLTTPEAPQSTRKACVFVDCWPRVGRGQQGRCNAVASMHSLPSTCVCQQQFQIVDVRIQAEAEH
jgi:hypothetical protein